MRFSDKDVVRPSHHAKLSSLTLLDLLVKEEWVPNDHRLYKYRRVGNKNLSGILFYKATPGVTSRVGFNFVGKVQLLLSLTVGAHQFEFQTLILFCCIFRAFNRSGASNKRRASFSPPQKLRVAYHFLNLNLATIKTVQRHSRTT